MSARPGISKDVDSGKRSPAAQSDVAAVEVWRWDLGHPAPGERLVAWARLRFSLAAITFAFNAYAAVGGGDVMVMPMAELFCLLTVPYFIAGLGLLWTSVSNNSFLEKYSLVFVGFEVVQIGLSFAFVGIDHTITLAYCCGGLVAFAFSFDGRHFLTLALGAVPLYAMLCFGVISGMLPHAPSLASPVASEPLLLEQLTVTATQTVVFFFGLIVCAGHWGAVLRWQQFTIQAQARFIHEQILTRYLPATLTDRLLEEGVAWSEPRRQWVTIFFSDLVGFTSKAEALEAEDLASRLNIYLESMVETAHRHGGTIDKFIGDAVMVLFGAPVEQSPAEQARCAVEMALDMQEQLSLLVCKGDDPTMDFLTRMGIHCGEAVVGNFGGEQRADFTAIGDNVNIAARLESACKPGTILVSGALWELLDEAFSGEALGPIELKNREEPVEVFELIPGGSSI